MLKDKSQRGMGFRCMDSMNVALLMKQIWRIAKNPYLLISKILSSKYFTRHSLLETQQKPTDSYAWKSLCGAFDVFKCGLKGDFKNPDDWKWKNGSSGYYSVKNRYQIAYCWKQYKCNTQGEQSNTVAISSCGRSFGESGHWTKLKFTLGSFIIMLCLYLMHLISEESIVNTIAAFVATKRNHYNIYLLHAGGVRHIGTYYKLEMCQLNIRMIFRTGFGF